MDKKNKKINIDEYDYNEIYEMLVGNKSIDNLDRSKLIEKLLTYKNYNYYYEYMNNIPNLNEKEREMIINSILSTNNESIIYHFTSNLVIKLTKNEFNMILEKLFELGFYLPFIKNNIEILKDNIDEIINNICTKETYSNIFDFTIEFYDYLPSNIDIIIDKIIESKSAFYTYKILSIVTNKVYKEKLTDSLCKLCDVEYLCSTIILVKNSLSEENIKDILSLYKETKEFKIIKTLIENAVSNLTDDNIKYIICNVFETNDKDKIEYIINNLFDRLTKEHIDLIIKYAIKTDDINILLDVSKMLIDKLDKEQIKKIADLILITGDVKTLYIFLDTFNFKLEKEEKNKFIREIINRKEIKFIILICVYIDISLTKSLFGSNKKLFVYAALANVFTLDELNKIKNELNIESKKPNYDNLPKKYTYKKDFKTKNKKNKKK